MVSTRSSSDTEALSRSDSDAFVHFLGLDAVVEVRDGEVWFPTGVLWPYTRDLRAVRVAYDAAGGTPTAALLAAMARLHERIAFAPGPAAEAVYDAHHAAREALAVGTATSEAATSEASTK